MSIIQSQSNRQPQWVPLICVAAALSLPLTYHLLRSRDQSPKGVDASGIPPLPLFVAARDQAEKNPNKIAIIDTSKGQSFTYRQLLHDVSNLKERILKLLKLHNKGDLDERRVAFLIPAGYDYVVCQWAVWAAGGVCVPLCKLLPFKQNFSWVHR